MEKKYPIAIAKGDGIGPNIMDAVLYLLEKLKAPLKIQEVTMGETAIFKENPSGISQEDKVKVWDTEALLLAPAKLPQGILPLRNNWSLQTKMLHIKTFFPCIPTTKPDLDLHVLFPIWEWNLEYRHTIDGLETIHLLSEKEIHYLLENAFWAANAFEKKHIHFLGLEEKMDLSNAAFMEVYNKIIAAFPDILYETIREKDAFTNFIHYPQIYDILALGTIHATFFVKMLLEISGVKNFTPLVYLGDTKSIFSTVQKPQDPENPSALIISASLLLQDIGQDALAETLYNAWLTTIEEKKSTPDIECENPVNLKDFIEAIEKNFGKKPKQLKEARLQKAIFKRIEKDTALVQKTLIGCDISIHANPPLANFLDKVSHIAMGPLHLTLILNQGMKVWPNQEGEDLCNDEWVCRFTSMDENRLVSFDHILQIAHAFETANIDVVKLENLYNFNGQRGYLEKIS